MAKAKASPPKTVKTSISDIERYLEKKYEFRHNPILERTEFRDVTIKNSPFHLLSERDVNSLYRDLNNNRLGCTITSLRSLLNSDFIGVQNPFEEYFISLPTWNNTKPDYIEQLAQTITAENDTFWKWAFKKWLVNLVACALEGTTLAKKFEIKTGINQHVLVFVGKQGIGKTTWLNNLLPGKLEGYLYAGIVNPSNKDTLVNLSENLIINLDELENLNKTELGSLKSLITQSAIRLRRSYGIYNENYVRRASFVGSVNEAEFLTDTTGNRRYLVIETTAIDYKHKVAMDNVYSQVYYLYKNRFEFEFRGNDIDRIDDNNNKFIRQSMEEELLLQYYRVPEKDDEESSIVALTPTEIINLLQAKVKIKIGDPSSIRRLGNALHKHNFQKISKGNSKPYQLVKVKPVKAANKSDENENDKEQTVNINTGKYGFIKLKIGIQAISVIDTDVHYKINCFFDNEMQFKIEFLEIGFDMENEKNKIEWFPIKDFESDYLQEIEKNKENADTRFWDNLKCNIDNAKIEIEEVARLYIKSQL